jgi:glucokinase
MANGRLAMGVDLGATKVLLGLVDERGNVVARRKRKTQADEGASAVIERVVESARDLLKEAGDSKVRAAGVGFAGPVDFKRGVVITAGNMPWHDVPLGKILADRLKLSTVVIDNDTNAGTYGEWRRGAATGRSDFMGVFVGTGIGAGLVLDGRMYRGQQHTAGEIGHTIINAGGGLARRSMEDLASRTAMGITLARRIRTNHPSSAADLSESGDLFLRIRSKALSQAYQAGDAEVVAIVQESARYIGTAIGNVVTMLSLPLVVLGGGVTEALGKPFVELVRQHVRTELFPPELMVDVIAAKLGDDATMVGAAAMAHEAVEGKGKD